MKKLVFCLFMLVALAVGAQNADRPTQQRTVHLRGTVSDAFSGRPLKARIVLLRPDSSLVAADSCLIAGSHSQFDLAVPAVEASFIVRASCEGYTDRCLDYELKYPRRRRIHTVPRIMLSRSDDIYKELELDEVHVEGTKVKLQYKGDTIVYNAAAFNLPEGSMLDALVRQLSGAELRPNGDLYVNGQRVDYLTLNGKDFLDDDRTLMLHDLPAYMVRDLRAYHRPSRRSRRVGHDVEQKDYVVEVRLRREYNEGFAGNAEAGVGTSRRYDARLFGLYTDDFTQLSVYGRTNNVNEMDHPDEKGEWETDGDTHGRVATRVAGLHLSRSHPEGLYEEELTAKVGWSSAESRQRGMSELFTDGASVVNRWEGAAHSRSFLADVSNEFILQRPFRLAVTLGLEYEHGHTDTEKRDTTLHQAVLNRLQDAGLARNDRLELSAGLVWTKELAWGDFLTVDGKGSYSKVSPDRTFAMKHIDFTHSELPDFSNALLEYRSRAYDYSLSADYTFVFPSELRASVGIGYEQAYSHEDNDFFRLDWLEGYYGMHERSHIGVLPSTRDSMMMVVDIDNTDNYDWMRKQFKGAARVYRNGRQSYFNAGLSVARRCEKIDYHWDGVDRERRSYTVVRPELTYNRWAQPSVQLAYHMDTEVPEFIDVLPLDDTTDPLEYVLFNTSLKSSRTHSASVSVAWNNDSTKQSLGVSGGLDVVRDAWGMHRVYSPETGIRLVEAGNVNGNWMGRAGFTFSRPLDRRQLLMFEQETSVMYHHSVDFNPLVADYFKMIDEETMTVTDCSLSKVNNLLLKERAGFTYQKGDLTLGVSGQLAWRRVSSKRVGFETISAFDYDWGASLVVQLPLGIGLSSDLRMFSRRGYATDLLNGDHLVWNAQLTRSFLDDRLTAKLQACDLLQQRSNVDYEVNAQGRTEVWYNSLPRYVMFSLAWRFGNKQDD